MDDGTYNYRSLTCEISSLCFTLGEDIRIKSWFVDRWELKPRINPRRRGKDGRNQYSLYFNQGDAEKFLRIVQPFIRPLFTYKLGHLHPANKKKLQLAREKEKQTKKKNNRSYWRKNKKRRSAQIADWRREKYKNDPVWREYQKKYHREYLRKYRASIREGRREVIPSAFH